MFKIFVLNNSNGLCSFLAIKECDSASNEGIAGGNWVFLPGVSEFERRIYISI